MSEREAISTLGLLDLESLVDEREGGWIRTPQASR
jgi:hypothetical protein